MIGLQTGTVKLSAYSRQWGVRFASESRRLSRQLGSARHRIEHIGSTAVPGLEAKPIIDIAVMIPSFRQLTVWIRRFEKAGYLYKGEYGLPGRHFFTRGAPVTHHLHLVEKGSLHWDNWILFRDYLRSHPAEAERYRLYKKKLAERFVNNRDSYTRAKTPFVTRMLARARRSAKLLPGPATHG
jgi:GrpB-like predicted nucleotidyltransferase (UPF0157 family)